MKPQDPPADAKSSKTPSRKAYHKPQLQVYGDLAEIVKSVVGTNKNDGAGHPNKHYTS